VLLSCLVSYTLVAQNRLMKHQEISLTVGSEVNEIDRFAPTEQLDFMNYCDPDQGLGEISRLKLGYSVDFYSKLSTELKVILMSDLIPDSYDVDVRYFLKPWLGFGVGSMLTKNWMTSFEEYQAMQLPDYYLVDENVKQFTTYDVGYYLSAMLKPIDTDGFNLRISCNVGVSSYMKEEVKFFHKKKLSNERLQYHYITHSNFQPFIQPEIDVRINAFSLNDISYGLLLHLSYFHSNRSMNYTRTIQTWTSENKVTERIESPKHSYSNVECNVGLFVCW